MISAIDHLSTNLVRPEVDLSPQMAARTFLENWARRKIRGFEGTIDENGEYLSEIYSTANSISEQIAADYHGRFLIELIQNGHDVHPDSRRDGEIEVLFDASAAPHGTLYIANGGAPFSRANVKALSDLGLSSKQPGQAIGNKGLGFRSVRHVCDAPHIYSQAEGIGSSPGFHGFCFRFANEADLTSLTSGPRQLELASKDLPPFHIPVWVDEQPSRVTEFAARGFATVISLPLRDARAAETVVAEIDALRGLGVPMLLFLTRLARLEIRGIDAAGNEGPPLRLTRLEEQVLGAPLGIVVADLGSAGRHLIARGEIEETTMLEAITAGIDQGQLHSHWAEWKGKGEVAISARLDEAASASRLFTFLPMGEQAYAPFRGFLHASFFPTANRKGLDGTVRLNAMLLERAADLAADTVAWLAKAVVSHANGLGPEQRAKAAVDLMCWKKVQSFETTSDLAQRVARGVASAMGVVNFGDAPVTPVLVATEDQTLELSWRSPRAARRWNHTGETFSLAAAARHAAHVGTWPIWPGLESRTDALLAYVKTQTTSYSELPTPAERAALAVQVAVSCQGIKMASTKTWTKFYKELAEFMGAGGGALADQHILWCEDGELHPAMSIAAPAEDARQTGRRRIRQTGRVAVFAPPARKGPEGGEGIDMSPPSALAENFAFLAEQLDWYGELADARAFLQRHKLVLEFDRESILTQLSRVLRNDIRHNSRSAGLRWAFQIWRGPQGKGRSVSLPANLRLYVPTAGSGFVLAEQALFSGNWPERTRGRLVQRLLDAAPPDSIDLQDIALRRLAGPDHYAFRVGTVELWTDFLTDLGVKRGLHPISKSLSGVHRGHLLDGSTYWRQYGLSEVAVARWKQAVAVEKPAALSGSSTYSLGGELLWMPGQWDVARFDRDALEVFALLVIAWLGETLPESLSVTVRHSTFNHADVRQWSTPLKWFLREVEWIPAQEPTSSGVERVAVKPSQIWMASETGDRFPHFLRRPAAPVMRALDAAGSAHIAAIRKHTGLSTLDNSDTLLSQAAFLAEQFAKPGFDKYYERHLANLYAGTWQRAADHYRTSSIPHPDAAPNRILARRAGALQAFTLRGEAATEEPIYVRDVDDETAASLVEAAGLPILEIRAGDKSRLGQVMHAFYGKKLRLLSQANYGITIDGQEVGTGEVEATVVWCPRLSLMVAVAMEAMRGLDARTLPVNRQTVLDRLDRIVVQTGTRLGFKLDDFDHDELETPQVAFGVKLADGRAVIVVQSDGRKDWDQLDQSLTALCDALDHPGLEQGLRILLRALKVAGATMSDTGELNEDVDALCESLRLTSHARRVVRETMAGGLERHLPWLRAIVYLDAGQLGLDAFVVDEPEAVQDADRLRQAITPWISPLRGGAQAVLDACRTSLSVAELRATLHLDFEGMNHALVIVGQKPDTYTDVHLRQLANWIKSTSKEILDALRTVFAPTLVAGGPAPGYAIARDATVAMAPDPAWAMRWQEVPESALREHVDAWLASQGAAPLGTSYPDLAPVDEVRRTNGQSLKEFVVAAVPLIRAWYGARGQTIISPWGAADGGAAELRTLLDKAGVFDFEKLDRDALLTWVNRLHSWPPGMKLTLNRDELELGDVAIAEARAKAEAAVAEKRKKERSIEFNGQSRDPEDTDWAAIDAELMQTLSREFLDTPVGHAAALAAAPARSGVRPSSGQGRWPGYGGNGARQFAPSAKTDMIGRLGELAVRRWLQTRLPKQDIDAGWRSTNGTAFTGREGNDGLGYDFEISWQRQTWQIEVKASLNDPQMFEMGETEVGAARVAARLRSGVRFWIAYVSNLANPAQARVEMIANPLSEEGERVLKLVGEGLRYTFRRS
ncbi:sacsin N-terminal ATP-binding-like domain-containing protein [Agrobacterium rosae]|uniref:sacsin N-terminal ATP-binding-like domain-containing protein n=1 Tax=Agrobacterium rosae TaxID=1972867 RepID=UPI003BA059A2